MEHVATNLMDLPQEVIERILALTSIEDTINFALINKKYEQQIMNNKHLWRRIIMETWPEFSQIMQNREESEALVNRVLGILKDTLQKKRFQNRSGVYWIRDH